MKIFYRLLWLALGGFIVAGLVRLKFDVEVLNLLPDRVPAVRGLKFYQQHFANAQELIVTLRSPDPEPTEADACQLDSASRTQSSLVSAANTQPAWLHRPAHTAGSISL